MGWSNLNQAQPIATGQSPQLDPAPGYIHGPQINIKKRAFVWEASTCIAGFKKTH